MFITCPKLIVAAVNGNASGFGAALLGLCDVVYATSKVSEMYLSLHQTICTSVEGAV